MNKITKELGKVIAASMLTIGAVAFSLPSQAATFTFDVTGDEGTDINDNTQVTKFAFYVTGYGGTDINDNTRSYPSHNGRWIFTVTLLGGPPRNQIKFEVTSTPSDNTNGDEQYIGYTTTIPIIKIENGVYYFEGKNSDVALIGTYNGKNLDFSSIISGTTHYIAESALYEDPTIPEPFDLGAATFVGVGLLGLRFKIKQSQALSKGKNFKFKD